MPQCMAFMKNINGRWWTAPRAGCLCFSVRQPSVNFGAASPTRPRRAWMKDRESQEIGNAKRYNDECSESSC